MQYGDLPDEEDEEGAAAGEGAPKLRAQGGDAQQAPAGKQQPGSKDAAAAAAAGEKRDVQAAALEAAQSKAKKAKEAKQSGWFDLKINTNV